MSKTLEQIKERYRIITNGDRFRVQRRNMFGMWTDCPVAGRYMDPLGFNSVGEYRSEDDAQAALDDLSGQEFAEVQRKERGWKEL